MITNQVELVGFYSYSNQLVVRITRRHIISRYVAPTPASRERVSKIMSHLTDRFATSTRFDPIPSVMVHLELPIQKWELEDG